MDVPQGAEEADGVDTLARVVRDQIGKGADWIKVYADYRWGRARDAADFTLDELKLIVEIAQSAGTRSPHTPTRRKACAAPRSQASRRLSTATPALPRSSG